MNQKKTMDELNRASADEMKQIKKTPVILVLDNVRSMNNVGSVFRTSDAFAIEEILLCGYTPQPPHRDIQKTALGATETVAWQHFETTQLALDYLHQKNIITCAIEQVHDSISLEKFEINKTETYALILGNEVEGVDQNIINNCKHIIEIPQGGSKHSLNISVTAGVVAWHFYSKMGLG
jgi:23S rRNA (guanosine2251-2'-O)-methyltransferase